ncbi:S1 RNA-binding domain-containing protein [Sporolactobacillus kofuensis]|uniref:S1 RNA-binding domain-containing protein n=1 Tax=Sporolactobacillus kofuensis TaxID=269672 RepID=A0ABW1WK72_9BACL|nr:S1-like domain-containing RNA-binding protein [Sporolactobacillus kofuensis]MCO7176891.1 S1-like domain-containing RNA-binding protein [Sporolactobacillus kofuensis]
MAELIAGTVAELEVSHKAPFGYFLTDGNQEVLLHDNDVTGKLTEKEKATVFLYQDHQGRLAATMTIPEITMSTFGWATAVTLRKKYGVFVDIGISKDILLSKDDLPDEWFYWPQPGDKIYCSLKFDKKQRLFARLADETVINTLSVPAPAELRNKNVQAKVYRLLLNGAHVLTDEGYIGFIHQSETTDRLRVGEAVECRVIAVKENGTLNLSMRPRSYETIDQNVDKIVSYMESRDGAMPYWDKSLPEDIKQRFDISKGDFKKALGQLMKEGKLDQKDGWSYLKQE